MDDRTGHENADRPRVLVVEDDSDIAALIVYHMVKAGYRVETAANGTDGLECVDREPPDLVVLDRLLPGAPGDDVLRTLRANASTRALPVLMLTALGERTDRIEGLELGADDYLAKPFDPRELLLRTAAILRRARDGETIGEPQRVLGAGALRLYPDARRVTLDDHELPLTPTEFRLLESLLESRGRAQTRRQLLRDAWPDEWGAPKSAETRTVDMHVRRLRAKLGPAGRWIETVRGCGYRFAGPV